VFERYTEPSRQVIVLAQEEARLMRHGHIGTEHLLLGLARVDDASSSAPLAGLGLTVERARAEVVRHVPVGSHDESGAIPFTGAAREALEVALREALGLGHSAIRPGHLLLGVLRQADGVARRVLVEAGGDVQSVRAAIAAALGEPVVAAPPGEGRVGPVHLESTALIGDPDFDSRLLLTILACNSAVAERLRERGVDELEVRRWAGLD
jgi:ATP-dependent Clp protease ATP-binding subunit ClpC